MRIEAILPPHQEHLIQNEEQSISESDSKRIVLFNLNIVPLTAYKDENYFILLECWVKNSNYSKQYAIWVYGKRKEESIVQSQQIASYPSNSGYDNCCIFSRIVFSMSSASVVYLYECGMMEGKLSAICFAISSFISEKF
jgi:hypothetical protein